MSLLRHIAIIIANRRLIVVIGLLLLASIPIGWKMLIGSGADLGEAVLKTATLQSAAGERSVSLPHALSRDDFAPEGQRVRYRLSVTIDDPTADRAIYIVKMSRSGRVWLNGHDLGSCGPLELERLRCLHQPQMFRPNLQYWRSGINEIEVEIFGSSRQTNGLSEIIVGNTDAVYHHLYRPAFMLRVESIDSLSWLTLSLGLLALLIFATQRTETLYGWFGATCVFGFLSNLNILVTAPTVSLAMFDWFVFSTRIIFTCLLGITYLTYFGKNRPAFIRLLTIYAALAPLGVWLANANPIPVSLIYIPLQTFAVIISVASLRWAYLSRRTSDWLMAASFLIMPLAGMLDLARLRGGGAFAGTYLLVYTSTVTLALMGIGIIGTLALALRTTRNLSNILQQKIREREAELSESHRRIIDSGQQRARAEEREWMMRDMHDGFLSTLSVTKLALASGQVSTQQASVYVSDCVDDLRLMLEAYSSETGALEDALADFVYRFRGRIAGSGMDLALVTGLAGMPGLSAASLLQVMRILQEATNNALRHSMAPALNISAQWIPKSNLLILTVDDDGRGITASPNSQGRGMANMRARTLTLNGILEIESGMRGTCVRVTVPISRSATRSDAAVAEPAHHI